MPVRVLHVVTSMDVGGIETFLMNIYRKIDRSKIQFDFLVHRKKKGYYEEEISAMGGNVFRTVPFKGYNSLHYRRVINDFLSDFGCYHIVHSHISAWSYYILYAAKQRGIPVRIAHSHEAHKTLKEISFVKLPFAMHCIRKLGDVTTQRFACSRSAVNWLFGEGSDVVIINNAVETDAFAFKPQLREKAREEFEFKNKFVIGHIGNFTKAKNYPFLLKVFSSVVRRNQDSVLLLIGDFSRDRSIKQRVHKMGLDKYVIFTGIRRDIGFLLQGVDVFLFPSVQEAFPVSLIEAQASGLVCVISDSISDEVMITDSVKKLPLGYPTEQWANEILKYVTGYDRYDKSDDVRSAGFDINDNANWLQEFYLRSHFRTHDG